MKNTVALVFVLLALLFNNVQAQQTPIMTHYYANPFLLNPAEAGSFGHTQLYMHYRKQFVDIPGSPETAFITVDGAIPNKKMGLGVSISNDQTDILNRTSALGTYAYHLDLNENHHLSFGLSAGFLQNRIDFDRVNVTEENDEVILNHAEGRTVFDGSFGIKYRWKKLQVGLASHQLLQNDFVFARQSDFKELRFNEARHYFGSVKYRFTLSDSLGIHIDPLVMVRSAQGTPVQFEGGLNINWKDQLWVGALYRHGFGMAIQAGVYVQERMAIGYAYDLSFGNLSAYESGTHEILLGYRFIPASVERERALEEKVDRANDLIQEQFQRLDALESENTTIKEELEEKSEELEKTKEEVEALKRIMEENDATFGSLPEYEKELLQQARKDTEESNSSATTQDGSGNPEQKNVAAPNSNQEPPANTNTTEAETSNQGKSISNRTVLEPATKTRATDETKEEFFEDPKIVYNDLNGGSDEYQYRVILGAFKSIDNAKLYQRTIRRELGYESTILKNANGSLYLVDVFQSNTAGEAINKVNELKSNDLKGLVNGNPWIYALVQE